MKRDEELMFEYKVGHTQALEDIFQRYKVRILNFAFRILGNRADAEDVVGEVFYILTDKKESFRQESKFSTWLYAIARNACIDRIRRRKRIVFMWFKQDKGSQDFRSWDIADDKNFIDDVTKKDIAYHIKAAVNKLPLSQKEAIVLREYHNLSYEEISEILTCSISKVKILIYRARKRLKNKLLPVLGEVKNV